MEEKDISKMTEKEILRQQLELLAERSKEAEDSELHGLTMAMSDVIYSISRVPEIPIQVESTVPFSVKDIQSDQRYIWEKLNNSIKEQRKWNKIQIACLTGMIINLALFIIYLLGHL